MCNNCVIVTSALAIKSSIKTTLTKGHLNKRIQPLAPLLTLTDIIIIGVVVLEAIFIVVVLSCPDVEVLLAAVHRVLSIVVVVKGVVTDVVVIIKGVITTALILLLVRLQGLLIQKFALIQRVPLFSLTIITIVWTWLSLLL